MSEKYGKEIDDIAYECIKLDKKVFQVEHKYNILEKKYNKAVKALKKIHSQGKNWQAKSMWFDSMKVLKELGVL